MTIYDYENYSSSQLEQLQQQLIDMEVYNSVYLAEDDRLYFESDGFLCEYAESIEQYILFSAKENGLID